MKKLFIFAICVLTLTACGDGMDKRKLAELNQRIDSLRMVNVEKDNEINDLMDTYNLIEEGFQAINEAQERVTVERSGEGNTSAAHIKENMAFIQETLQQNKELISNLQKIRNIFYLQIVMMNFFLIHLKMCRNF